MKHLIALVYLIVSILFTNCNGSFKQSHSKKKYKTVITYLKVDSLPEFKYKVEKYDSSGNLVESVMYADKTGLIEQIVKYYFDTSKKMKIGTLTRFGKNSIAYTEQIHNYYNNKSLLTKDIWIHNGDTSETTFEYNPNNKIKQKIIKSKYSIFGNGLYKYIYDDKDSLLKIESFNQDGTIQYLSHYYMYSASYTTCYEWDENNELRSKNVDFFKDNKKMKESRYSISNAFSKGDPLKLRETIVYTYKDGLLVKEIKKIEENIDWCGFGTPEEIRTYRYVYR